MVSGVNLFDLPFISSQLSKWFRELQCCVASVRPSVRLSSVMHMYICPLRFWNQTPPEHRVPCLSMHLYYQVDRFKCWQNQWNSISIKCITFLRKHLHKQKLFHESYCTIRIVFQWTCTCTSWYSRIYKVCVLEWMGIVSYRSHATTCFDQDMFSL